ncbi:NAD+ synthase [Halorubrum aquaticum]|uniref:NH(3)-dependent NAD(+) synthetase n=1 Tax=Halorubrum aquaticum TaxID=387340 RepID=A0A1I2ZHK1_9EURY|nr:NAD+ synthase [Halorubrum aquaticum]SFH36969.1 NAD+ synthase [Halorubrum aquaticum]
MDTSTRTDPGTGAANDGGGPYTSTRVESDRDPDSAPGNGDAPTDHAGTTGSADIADPDDVGADDVDVDAIDPGAELERAVSFVRETVSSAGADGVVVNLSGGLDSTVTAAIAVEALGSDRVYGLILPCNKVGAHHARDAEGLAEALGIEHDTVHLQPLLAQFGSVAPDRFGLHDEPTLVGNATARLRMTLAYLAANATDRLVCGTTNRSERLLGYVTKHGDGAVDLLPIGHLYKTEVRALAAELDVPRFVLEKPPTAGALAGQRDADDLGADYDVVDPVLRLAIDEGIATDAIASRLGLDREVVDDLLERHRTTEHKRHTPPMPTDRRSA